jgi:ketosteroid isomerase-like protein
MTTSEIHDLLEGWAAAETAGDTAAMASLITDDFSAVGPLGFTLDRDAWLTRFDHGLAYTSVTFEDEPQVRVEGDTAIVTVRENTVGTYRGNPVPEALRTTAVLSRGGGRWQLVRVHMSFVAGTRGAPPVPGRP